jgi:hypothetical protein
MDGPPDGRYPKAARRPLYQAYSVPFLQPSDTLAERRLGHVQRARRGTKSPVLHDLGEGKKIVEVVHFGSLCCLRLGNGTFSIAYLVAILLPVQTYTDGTFDACDATARRLLGDAGTYKARNELI